MSSFPNPNNDWDEFNRALAQRQAQERADEAHYRGPQEAAWVPEAPKTPINGVGLGLVFMSPCLFMVYPVLGMMLWSPVLVVLLEPVLPLGALALIGLGLYVAAWFVGFKVERKL